VATLIQDLRYALRTLRRAPGFTLVAVLTLALGIGANTAIFSVVYAVLLNPLPYPNADRLVAIWGARGADRQIFTAYTDVEDWRAGNHSFEDIGVIRGMSVNLTGGETPERIGGEFITAPALTVLGAVPALGRMFTPEETAPGGDAAVTVISDRMWRTKLGGDPAVVGRTLLLNGRPTVVIGVLSRGFESPFGGTDLWLPITAIPSGPSNFQRGVRNVWAVGRLKPGMELADGQRDLSAISARLAADYPASNTDIGATVLSLRDQVAGPIRPALLTLLAAVVLVLLVAGANVANLQLARALARRQELSLRAALGADRGRLFRQMFTESLVLSLFGGAAGVGLALLTVSSLVAAVPGGLPASAPVGINREVLLFSLAVTLLAAVTFGLTPAWYGVRSSLGSGLKPRAGETGGRIDPRSVLVVGELGFCLVLLIGAGLLLRSLDRMQQVRPGFEPHNLLTFQFRLPAVKYQRPDQVTGFFSAALEEVRRVPGLSSAALVQATPMSGNWGSTSYVIDGQAAPPAGQEPVAQYNVVSDGYFHTMQIPVLAGREFDSGDRKGSLPVAIVNAELARREWPGESPLGKRLHEVGDSLSYTVVGVVGDTRQLNLGEVVGPQLYRPILQVPFLFSNVVARTVRDPQAVAPAVRAAIWAVDRDQPVWGIASMEQLLDRSIGRLRFTMRLTAGFALLALILAGVGVYGVISYLVTQRTRDVGIRLAVGATPSQAVAPIMRHGLRLTLVAMVLGLAAAVAGTRLLAGQLFEVGAVDPATYAVVALGLAVVALLASWFPARRAARVDPMIVLRGD
jgi:putative ABC transport system permease protein